MAWDASTHGLITKTRLLLASPDVVYQALEDYGQYCVARILPEYDEELEKALAERNDQLIDLGLAKNAASHDLVARLYQQSLKGTGDPDYDKAVRIACLANQMTAKIGLSSEIPGVDQSEFRRLALEGDDDELDALMRNPTRRNLLADAYGRRAPVEDIPDERWFQLVRCSVGNPGLNTDNDSRSGPDFLMWDIQKALVDLLKTAPIERDWVYILYELLRSLNPANIRGLDSQAAVLELLERWKTAKVPSVLDRAVEKQGYFSPYTLVEEFCGLMAALYGRVFVDGKSVYVGKFDSEDLLLRCAYYGQAEMMRAEQMKTAWLRDNQLFVLAALFNDGLLLESACRQRLEQYVTVDLRHIYTRRCTQLQSKYKWFNPTPVTDVLKENQEEPAPPADASMVGNLSAQVIALKSQVATLSKWMLWGFIILGVLALWHR